MKKLITLFAAITLNFAGSAQNLQGGMETWVNYSAGGFPFPATQLERPSGWHGADSLICAMGPFLKPGGSFHKQLFKSTDAHSGSFAALLLTRDQDTLGITQGIMTNAKINVNIATQEYYYTGGTPVTNRIDTVRAWIKYMPRGGDEGLLTAQAVITGAGANGRDSVVGEGLVTIQGDTAYQEVVAVLQYPNPNLVPNALQVTFLGHSTFGNAHDSTEMYVDDVTAVSAVGIKMQLFEEEVVTMYPNPATNSLHLNSSHKETLIWNLYTSSGARIIATADIKENSTVDISHVAAGVYIYQVKNREGDIIQSGKLSVVK